MKKTVLAMLFASVALVGCESASKSTTGSAMTTLTQQDFLHRNWELTAINGKPISVFDGMNVPNLEVGENFSANGNNGCNNFFGQGEIKGAQFRVNEMASTMMACPEPATILENAMTSVLSDWSNVTLTANTLELQNSAFTLNFTLRELVN